MPCIHSLDNNNCPICRMTKSTIPLTPIHDDAAKIENLRPENPFYKKYLANKNRIGEDLMKNNYLLQPHIINPLPTPNLINTIPSFESKELRQKLDELTIERFDKYGVSKRVKLENAHLKLDED